MKVKYYETIFEVTETLQNGKERRIKKSVYSEIFRDGKHISAEERLRRGVDALKAEHYYNIVYIDTKTTFLIFG
jgi:hypothetical protein